MRILTILLIIVFSVSGVNAQRILASNEFEAEEVNSVSIKGRFCDVIIKGGDKVYFKGIIEGSGDEDDYEIISDLRGNDLYITVEKNNRSWDRVTRSELRLTVPENIFIRVDNSSGDVFASDLVAQDYEFEASSGDIELSNIAARLSVETSSGDIEVEDINGEIYAESTSGDQQFEEITGNIETRSTSGDIEINNYRGDIYAKASSGDIDVDRGMGALNLKTTSGDIGGYGVELTDDSEFRASSGSIVFELSNDPDDLSFDLQTSSGNLRAGGRSGDKSLYIKRGGYWIRAVTSSGNVRFSN